MQATKKIPTEPGLYFTKLDNQRWQIRDYRTIERNGFDDMLLKFFKGQLQIMLELIDARVVAREEIKKGGNRNVLLYLPD